MDMSVGGEGTFWRRLVSPAGITSVSHNFVMEWAAILRDLVIGLFIAGMAGAWIPDTFWRHLFFTGHPLLAKVWGPLIGPLVAVVTFVCSIGNVPLSAVLWNGGISFGGVISFVFADLIIVPLLFIYAKYYGKRMACFLFATFLCHDGRRWLCHRIRLQPARVDPVRPAPRHAKVGGAGVTWNYTTWLNMVSLVLAAALLWRFFRTGGREMLSMMGGGPDDMAEHGHAAH